MVGPNGEEFANWLELANGCVCCEVRDELARGIERLMELKGAFDYVLVETTGMADPGPVAEQFWLDAELESPLRLDGIVAVVDAVHFWRHSRDLEACRQVGCADAVLVNKLDALEQQAAEGEKDAEAALASLTAHLQQLNALAPQYTTTRSQVPLERILNLRAYDTGSRAAVAAAEAAKRAATNIVEAPFAFTSGTLRRKGNASRRAGAAAADVGDAAASADGVPLGMGVDSTSATMGQGASAGAAWLHHDASFGAVTLEVTEPMDRAKLDAFFAVLFWEPEGFAALADDAASLVPPPHTQESLPPSAAAALTPEVFRAKGVLSFAGCGTMWTMQAVHSTFEVCEAGEWSALHDEAAAPARATRLVFIGRHLSKQRLEAALLACRASI